MKSEGCWIYIVVFISCFMKCKGDYVLTSSSEYGINGQNFSFTCTYSNQFVQFMRDNLHLCSIGNTEGNCNTGGCKPDYEYRCSYFSATLNINEITDELHRSIWSCLSPIDDKDKSNEKILYVKVPITLVTISNVTEGSNITEIIDGTNRDFHCTTDAGRPRSNIQWYLSGKNITDFTSSTINIPQGNEMVVSSSVLSYTWKLDDEMKFLYCTASNTETVYSVRSANITIKIIYGPKEVNINPPTKSYLVNETGSINTVNCTANCKPSCTMEWKRLSDTISIGAVLNLKNISRTQAGNYTCIASNQVGSNSSDAITIVVNYGPRQVNLSPINQTYTVTETGNLVPISCTANCVPDCTFTWSGPNLTSGTSFILSLQNIDRNQAGKYHCTAKNMIGNANKAIDVIVNYGPKQVYLNTSIKSFTVNETGTIGPILCTSDCKPSCNMTWTNMNVTVGTTSILNLQNINRNQTGNFTCIATNIVGSSQSHTISIIVNYGPQQVVINSSAELYTLDENDSVEPISCTADCKPICTITWSGPNLPISNSSVLHLQHIDRNQAGVYFCIARNFLNITKSVPVNITVNYGPRNVQVNSSKMSYTVNETESIDGILCTADCKPTCRISWHGPNYHIDTGAVLKLNNISKTQAGNYSCMASNSVGNKTSVRITVTVNYIPVISGLTGNNNVSENGTVFIFCSFSSVPVPEISWTFNNTPIKVQNIETNSTISKLALPHIECLSMGSYTCEAGNIVGKRSKGFQVAVLCSPRIYGQEDNLMESIIPIRENESINITAHVIAFPQPDFQWKIAKNGSAMNISSEFISNQFNVNSHYTSLFISNVTENDFGYYNLYAYNDIGLKTGFLHSYKVISARKPNQPENITCVGKIDSVEVFWQPGFNGGAPQHFNIYYKIFERSTEFDSYKIVYNDSKKDYMKAIIQPLQQDTRYMFKIFASNRYNYSVSEVTYCNTSVFTAIQKNNLTAIGTGTGIGMAIIVIIIVIVYTRRCKKGGNFGKKEVLLTRKEAKETPVGKTKNDGLKDNILYESAGSDFSVTNSSCGSAYAMVQKIRGNLSSDDDEKKETRLHSEVHKSSLTESKEKRANLSKNSNRQNGEEIYENVSENPPSNNLTINRDGLVYAELMFHKLHKGRKFIIHGIDNRTDYADIDLNLKADPLPSDESDKEEDNNKE